MEVGQKVLRQDRSSVLLHQLIRKEEMLLKETLALMLRDRLLCMAALGPFSHQLCSLLPVSNFDASQAS